MKKTDIEKAEEFLKLPPEEKERLAKKALYGKNNKEFNNIDKIKTPYSISEWMKVGRERGYWHFFEVEMRKDERAKVLEAIEETLPITGTESDAFMLARSIRAKINSLKTYLI